MRITWRYISCNVLVRGGGGFTPWWREVEGNISFNVSVSGGGGFDPSCGQLTPIHLRVSQLVFSKLRLQTFKLLWGAQLLLDKMSEFHFAWIESRRDSNVFSFWFSCFGFCFAEIGFWFAVCGFWFVNFFGFWFADFGFWFEFCCFWFLVSDSRNFVSDSCILVSDSRFFWFLIRRILVLIHGF